MSNARVRLFLAAVAAAAVVLLSAVLLMANGGAVQILSTNQASQNTCCWWRFEPSSAATSSTWVQSWMELPNSTTSAGWTASWNGSAWTPFQHGNYQDLFLTDNQNGYPVLSMLDLSYNLYFRSAANTAGSAWNPPVAVTSLADFPSMAVAANGRIVIGFDYIGSYHATVVSTNGGQTWTGPYFVSYQTGGRLVAAGNTFYLFSIDTSASPTLRLDLFQSADGATWSGPTVLDTYTLPRTLSPNTYCGHGYCGQIDYPLFVDAQGSPGALGWVVAYSVWSGQQNWIKLCAQGMSGCVTISYTADLFEQGVTTSTSGDLWLSTFTYSTPPTTIPLNQLGIYRTPAGGYLNGVINQVDPTSWAFFQAGSSSSNRCNYSSCFSTGEYVRPAMNPYTGATIPFVFQSPSNLTNLMQSFVQDPATGPGPVPGLAVGPVVPFGGDSRTPIPADEAALHVAVAHVTGVSPVPAH